MNIWSLGLLTGILIAAAPQRQTETISRTTAVDHHQHLFSPAVAKLSPTLAPVDAAALVALLDAAGIERAVVLSLAYQYGNPNKPAVEDEYTQVRAENDWTSQQVAKYPSRLRGFCAINPLRSYAIEEVNRCAKDPQLRAGLKMHFGNSDVDVTNPAHAEALRAVFRAANTHHMAIVVHMRTTISKQRPYGAAHARAFLDSVLPEAPDVTVQIAHLAGAGSYAPTGVDEVVQVFVDAIAKRDPRMSRVLFDVSGVAGLGPWKEHALLIAKRIRELGVERILYGSDGAGGGNPSPREALTSFRELPLTAAEFRTIEGNVAPYMR